MNKYLEKLAASNIAIKPSHEGLLHKKLGVKKGEKIAPDLLSTAKVKAKESGDTKTLRQITFAENAKKWKHKKTASDKDIAKRFHANEEEEIGLYKEKIQEAKKPEFKDKLKHILGQEKEHASILKKETSKL